MSENSERDRVERSTTERDITDPTRIKHKYGRINLDYAARLAAWPTTDDGPIYMVNLMKYHEIARYNDNSRPAVSGREADDKYNPASILNKIGASIVFVADVAKNHFGAEDWDRIAIVRYASRVSFIEMQSRLDFSDKHVHKAAGMQRTTLLASRPLDISLDARNRPSTLELKRVVMVVRQAADRAAIYAAMPSATVLDVEGTVLSDGRMWDTVQLINVATDADADEVVAGISGLVPNESYAMTLHATLDGLTA